MIIIGFSEIARGAGKAPIIIRVIKGIDFAATGGGEENIYKDIVGVHPAITGHVVHACGEHIFGALEDCGVDIIDHLFGIKGICEIRIDEA